MSSVLKNYQTIKPASSEAADMAKAKQINIRLTAEQERLLRQYCVRERVTLRDVVVSALARTVHGFESN